MGRPPLDLEPRWVDLARVYGALRARCIVPGALNELGDFIADAVLAGYVPGPSVRERIATLLRVDADTLFPRFDAEPARGAA